MISLLAGSLVALAVWFAPARRGRLRALRPPGADREGRSWWGGRSRRAPARPRPRGPVRLRERPAGGRVRALGRRRARSPRAPDLALALDLVAAALASGVPAAAALVAAGLAVDGDLGLGLQRAGHAMELGAAPADAWAAAGDGRPDTDDALHILRGQLDLCLEAGVAAGVVLRQGADAQRRLRRRAAEARAARLGVRLVLPLGLCILPAFVALGVLPVVYALSVDFLR